jgi:Mrp family chromosome partitioning ATPase
MWFRRRPLSKSVLKTPDDDADVGRRPAGSSSELPKRASSVDKLLNGAPSTMAPEDPLATVAVRMRHGADTPFGTKLYLGALAAAKGPSEGDSAYSFIRTQIMQRLREQDWRTVAVTSPSRKSGTTLTTINLAIRIARTSSCAVLLVELDLANPSFHKLLRFTPGKGVVDYLQHGAPVSEIEMETEIDGLVIIPAGSPVSHSSELLSSPKMARFVEELKLRYQHEIILFDLPSILSSDDAVAFSPFVDCSLLVVEEGETRISDVRQALDYLRSTRMLGIVLNQSVHVMNDGRAVSG